ncbi:MAG TPA: hypothetical protein VGO72_01430 [Herminiimonas sp.]|jgi:hypothetical protein|nr:hypothetical protein [Herminiimonas sp.]
MWSTSLPATCRNDLGINLSNSDFLRRYARRLLRDARSSEPSKALPVLRRVIAVKLMPELRVTDLYAVRETVQLKHVLHMLAKELGFPAWEICKSRIDGCDASLLDRYRLELGMFGDHEKNWFADARSALDWQRVHGGYLISYGKQVVAILAELKN